MFSASKSGQYQGYQISRSVRLRASASAYFNRTIAASSNPKAWTWSAWIKRGQLGSASTLVLYAAQITAGVSEENITFTNDTLRWGDGNSGVSGATTSVFRDTSAWYHVVIVYDSANATPANRLLFYVNGTLNAAAGASIPLNRNSYFTLTASNPVAIGRYASIASSYFDGYLTEINFIDGQSLPTGLSNWAQAFGVFNAYGVWSPIKYNGTYGTNGYYLNFVDNSGSTATTIGKDSSGNGNNWTPVNISVTAGATYDSMLDVPTLWGDGGNGRGNYATLNPLDIEAGTNTFSSANLNVVTGVTTAALSTLKIDSGKWYWEVVANLATGTPQIGVVKSPIGTISTNSLGQSANAYVYVSNGNKGNNNSFTAYGATFTTNDVIGVALDLDAGTITFYKNNVSQGQAFSGLSGVFAVALANCTALTSINFGQRPFSYTPPSGFKALNTLNLPTPTIANGANYFAATTYTGTGASRSVTNTVNNVSFQPDFVWVKGRSGATDHALYDAVRGVQLQLESNTTTVETTETTGLTAFNSNGFTVGALAQMNTNTATYVAWQWKEGATQGFDIVTYTGNGANRTIAHNLGVAPKMVIVKNRTAGGAGYWLTWHANMTSASYYLALNLTISQTLDTSVWNATAPTSSVFSVGTNTTSNNNGTDFVAYLFAEVAGFSRFGSYTGNGSTDGAFIYTGFRPRYVMVKASSAVEGWVVWDSERNTFNTMPNVLYPNLSNAEGANTQIDFLSNGFKLRNSATNGNISGVTYIYAAFAENPFKYSLAR